MRPWATAPRSLDGGSLRATSGFSRSPWRHHGGGRCAVYAAGGQWHHCSCRAVEDGRGQGAQAHWRWPARLNGAVQVAGSLALQQSQAWGPPMRSTAAGTTLTWPPMCGRPLSGVGARVRLQGLHPRQWRQHLQRHALRAGIGSRLAACCSGWAAGSSRWMRPPASPAARRCWAARWRWPRPMRAAVSGAGAAGGAPAQPECANIPPMPGRWCWPRPRASARQHGRHRVQQRHHRGGALRKLGSRRFTGRAQQLQRRQRRDFTVARSWCSTRPDGNYAGRIDGAGSWLAGRRQPGLTGVQQHGGGACWLRTGRRPGGADAGWSIRRGRLQLDASGPWLTHRRRRPVCNPVPRCRWAMRATSDSTHAGRWGALVKQGGGRLTLAGATACRVALVQ
jgi:hypothetical protein